MSQRKEKYARRMEGRVDKLEECVGKLGVDMTSQRIRLNSMEDDLAVYRAAVAHREEKAARRAIQEKRMERQRAEAERRERRTQRITWLSIILAALVLTAVAVMATTWAKADDQLSADLATPPLYHQPGAVRVPAPCGVGGPHGNGEDRGGPAGPGVFLPGRAPLL